MFIVDFNSAKFNLGSQSTPDLPAIKVTRRTEDLDPANVETSPGSLQVFLEEPDSADFDRANESPAICPLKDELKNAFEIATGWELAWGYSLFGQNDLRKVEIIDMSTAWPAGKATVNRAHCDRLANAISDLVIELEKSRD